MTAEEILEQLRPLATPSYKKVLQNHGIPEPVLGVKIEELKKFQKRIKKNHALAMPLYDTGVYEAQYLAGLIADETKMTKRDLRHWLKAAHCDAIREYTVAWVAAESRHAHDLASQWIDADKEGTASAGWATLSSLVAVRDDAQLDLEELERLLVRVQQTIHQQPDRVRYSMNGFVIAVGSYVRSLTARAVDAAEQIGTVEVDMGNTACKVPSAAQYIQKVQSRGAIGKKRKTARC